MDANGISGHAHMQRAVVIWRCWNGRAKMAAHGTSTHVCMLHLEIILMCWTGRAKMVVNVISLNLRLLHGPVAMLACCSGCEHTHTKIIRLLHTLIFKNVFFCLFLTLCICESNACNLGIIILSAVNTKARRYELLTALLLWIRFIHSAFFSSSIEMTHVNGGFRFITSHTCEISAISRCYFGFVLCMLLSPGGQWAIICLLGKHSDHWAMMNIGMYWNVIGANLSFYAFIFLQIKIQSPYNFEISAKRLFTTAFFYY